MYMRTKRIYFKKKTTKVVEEQGWVEADMDYTQVYDCFSTMAKGINSATTFKLMFWLLAHKTNNENGIDSSTKSFVEFNKYLGSDSITYRTYSNCMNELKVSGILTQAGRGHYYANPFMFWKGELNKRDGFILEEREYPGLDSVNPTLVKEPEIKLLGPVS